MGKGVLAVGVLFGGLGLVWNFLTFWILVFIAALGQAAEILLIPVIGFSMAAAAVVGGLVGLRFPRIGSLVLVMAGVGALAGPAAVLRLRPEVAVGGVDLLYLSLLLGWWAYGLVIGGVVGLATARRPRPRGREPPRKV